MQPPASAINFRDLGGLPIAGGGQVRPGVLYRSASPQFLTTEDAARLVRDLPLRLVLDLRYPTESATEGHGELRATGVPIRNVPVVGAGGPHIEMQVLSGAHDQLGAHYQSYVETSPASFVTALRLLAEPDGMPALIHCAAGKDRTGVMVAVLLSALGVADDEIVADYAITGENLCSILRNLRTAPTYGDAMSERPHEDAFAQAPAATMRRFLEWFAAEHGSAESFLLGAGLEPEALDTLRSDLVVRAAAA